MRSIKSLKNTLITAFLIASVAIPSISQTCSTHFHHVSTEKQPKTKNISNTKQANYSLDDIYHTFALSQNNMSLIDSIAQKNIYFSIDPNLGEGTLGYFEKIEIDSTQNGKENTITLNGMLSKESANNTTIHELGHVLHYMQGLKPSADQEPLFKVLVCKFGEAHASVSSAHAVYQYKKEGFDPDIFYEDQGVYRNIYDAYEASADAGDSLNVTLKKAFDVWFTFEDINKYYEEKELVHSLHAAKDFEITKQFDVEYLKSMTKYLGSGPYIENPLEYLDRAVMSPETNALLADVRAEIKRVQEKNAPPISTEKQHDTLEVTLLPSPQPKLLVSQLTLDR